MCPCNVIPFRSPAPIFVDSLHNCTTPSASPTPYPVPIILNDEFKACSNSSDCLKYCVSIDINGSITSCPASATCFCVSSISNGCFDSFDCLFGQACVRFKATSVYSYCLSCQETSVPYPKTFFVDENHFCNGNAPVASPISDTFKYCSKDSKSALYGICSRSRCKQLGYDGTIYGCPFSYILSYMCFCMEGSDSCESSRNCLPTEACVKLLPNASTSYCAACEAIPRRTPSPIFVDDLHTCFLSSPLPTPYQYPHDNNDFW